MIETSQLQTLIMVAKWSSFSKAAEDLGVTQSAVSQSIKNLEKRLGSALFQRQARQVVLTEAGKKMLAVARQFLGRLQEVCDEIHVDRDEMRGSIRVGTLHGLGKSWLGNEAIRFCGDYPSLSLEIQLLFAQDLIDGLLNNHLDALVVPQFAVPSVGIKTYLGDEKSVFVFPRFGPCRPDLPLDLEQLSALPTILYEFDDGIYLKWCRTQLGRAPARLQRRLCINSHGNILKAVSEGLGVAVVPSHVWQRSAFKEKVEVLSDNPEVFNSQIFLVEHEDNQDVARMKALKDFLRQAWQHDTP